MKLKEIDFSRFKILSGSALKLIAVITMLTDHVAAFIFPYIEACVTPIITLGSLEISLYYIFRKIGRLAFPIFCFLITEGYIHTKNKRKYGLNLIIFALISEIPFNLANSGSFIYLSKSNIFITLFLGLLSIYLFENTEGELKRFVLAALPALAALVLRCDYGTSGVILIFLIYTLRENRAMQALIALPALQGGIAAWCAFLPINMYNGERGFIKGRLLKYAFYSFYPLHILILCLIRKLLFT